jgi:DNA modification methylase
VVYDPFNGTGTTGVACAHKDMQWYFGSELSADQCEYSNNRIKTEMNNYDD